MCFQVIDQLPARVVVRTSVSALLGGMLIFVTLLAGLQPPIWSRTALVLQGIALLSALVLHRRIEQRRFLLYPPLLAGTIYVWDTTLPPPTLPTGVLRVLLPSIVLLGILAHLAYPCVLRAVTSRHGAIGGALRRVGRRGTAPLPYESLSRVQIRHRLDEDRRQGYAPYFSRNDFSRLYLRHLDFSSTTLRDIQLMDADLAGVRFSNASIYRADFARANLHGADLQGTILIDADFAGANLQGANLRHAQLIDVNLAGATLAGACLDGALLRRPRYSATTRWPHGFLLPSDAMFSDA